MTWEELAKITPLKLNIGGKKDSHASGRKGYAGWYCVGLAVGPTHGVNHKMPARFELEAMTVDAALSEHFLEHLTAEGVAKVLPEIYRVLKPSARFRIAVPDMLHPRHARSYAAQKDLGDDHHQSVWDYRSMSLALLRAGFDRIEPIHHWDEMGVFHKRSAKFGEGHGHVKRSPDHDRRNKHGKEYKELWSTSLIIDAFRDYPFHGVAEATKDRVVWAQK